MTLPLIHHLADSTILACVLGLLCLCIRRRGPSTRYMLWLIAVVKFAFPVELLTSLGENVRTLLAPANAGFALPVSLSRWIMSPAVQDPSTTARTGLFHPLILIWLIGSAIASVHWFRKLWAAHQVSASARGFEHESFLRLKEHIGLHRDVHLKYSNELQEPVLAGFWEPTVILPSALSDKLSPIEFESVILHELAHAKRFDNWTAAFAHVVSCVFWFYPLLWWIENRLHRERELACDEMVVRCGIPSDDYLASILKVCRIALTEDVAGVSGICGSNLKSRMEEIMSLSSERPSPRTPKFFLGGLAAAIAIVPLLAGLLGIPNAEHVYANGGKAAQSATAQSESPAPITCASADIRYAEGTVIQEGTGPEQMCVRVAVLVDSQNPDGPLKYVPSWVVTSEEARARTATVVHLTVGPPAVCAPKASDQKGLCSCENTGDFSRGARVNSSNGSFQLRCGNDGKWIQTTTPNVERK